MIIRSILTALFLSFFLLALPSTAQAASPHDVAEVVQMVKDTKITAMARHTKIVGTNKVPETTMVFVWLGTRYTLEFSDLQTKNVPGFAPKEPWLTVYTIPEGAKSRDQLLQMVDYGLDGSVEHGRDMSMERLYGELGLWEGVRAEGLQHRSWWQEQYNAAIAAAIAYKRSVNRKTARR